jgi:hypothetical protein
MITPSPIDTSMSTTQVAPLPRPNTPLVAQDTAAMDPEAAQAGRDQQQLALKQEVADAAQMEQTAVGRAKIRKSGDKTVVAQRALSASIAGVLAKTAGVDPRVVSVQMKAAAAILRKTNEVLSVVTALTVWNDTTGARSVKRASCHFSLQDIPAPVLCLSLANRTLGTASSIGEKSAAGTLLPGDPWWTAATAANVQIEKLIQGPSTPGKMASLATALAGIIVSEIDPAVANTVKYARDAALFSIRQASVPLVMREPELDAINNDPLKYNANIAASLHISIGDGVHAGDLEKVARGIVALAHLGELGTEAKAVAAAGPCSGKRACTLPELAEKMAVVAVPSGVGEQAVAMTPPQPGVAPAPDVPEIATHRNQQTPDAEDAVAQLEKKVDRLEQMLVQIMPQGNGAQATEGVPADEPGETPAIPGSLSDTPATV